MTVHLTKSLDTFTIEVVNINGADYVEIYRSGLARNGDPMARFLKCDADAPEAAAFFSALSELFGFGLVTIARKDAVQEN